VKPCFSVVQSKERYKKNRKRDREIIRDGSTNSMTPVDGAGAVEQGESMGDNEGGDGDVGADKGGVVEVGVKTGAKMGVGAGADVAISS
jgi:hypothetical protein